jgi:hypothetical protein
MYKIIGADQKEYGPVTDQQIRRWIAENRVNAQTQARAAEGGEWQPLSAFPEFADALAGGIAAAPGPLPGFAPSAGSRDAALQELRAPAIALKVTAILGLAMAFMGLIFHVLTAMGVDIGIQGFKDPQIREMFSKMNGVMGVVSDFISAAVGVLILVGASKMQSLQNYSLAVTASVLAMLPCISPCCLLGLPFGIWALVVLNRPEVKSQFN